MHGALHACTHARAKSRAVMPGPNAASLARLRAHGRELHAPTNQLCCAAVPCLSAPPRFCSPAAIKVDETATKLDETAATVVGLVKSTDAMAAQIDGLAESMTKANSKVAADIKGLTTNLDSSIKVLKAQTAAAQKSSADPLLLHKIYWLMHSKPVLPTNEAGFDNRVVGIGFEAYFNPYFAPMFTCVYSVAGDKGGKLTVSTAGKVVAEPVHTSLSYSIMCASPQYVPVKRTYALSVFYEDADGKR